MRLHCTFQVFIPSPFSINSEESTATYISRILFSRGQVQLPMQLVHIDDDDGGGGLNSGGSL
jgi:hypothetical protein